MVEKLALSLVHAARRLRPYFQNHYIIVKTNYPIQKILQKPDLAKRMSSRAVKLFEFNIRYEPHGLIKAQCLLDVVNDLQHTLEQSLHFAFKTSNNQAEYEAILAGLSLAREVGVRRLICKTDSKLIVRHLNDGFKIKDTILLQYYHLVRNVIQFGFDHVHIQHIPRGENVRADFLSKLASTKLKGKHKSLLQQTLKQDLWLGRYKKNEPQLSIDVS